MRVLRWVAAALLIWGLFVGIAYAIVPLVSPGRGSAQFELIGVALVAGCGFGLLRLRLGS